MILGQRIAINTILFTFFGDKRDIVVLVVWFNAVSYILSFRIAFSDIFGLRCIAFFLLDLSIFTNDPTIKSSVFINNWYSWSNLSKSRVGQSTIIHRLIARVDDFTPQLFSWRSPIVKQAAFHIYITAPILLGYCVEILAWDKSLRAFFNRLYDRQIVITLLCPTEVALIKKRRYC